ncbi:bacterial group 3 Ig-like protein [Acinetobacter baumannii AA-014]|nr:bacterial group 3 Ig-like protein [Acinetobacter baumannii AA-014]
MLADGPHTVSVTATDVAGNVSTPVTGTVTVDATAPTLAITQMTLHLRQVKMPTLPSRSVRQLQALM